MAAPQINAREVIRDIKAGVSDAELKAKYKISDKGLESLYRKLVEKNILTAEQVRARRQGGQSGPAEPRKRQTGASQQATSPASHPKPPTRQGSPDTGAKPRTPAPPATGPVPGAHGSQAPADSSSPRLDQRTEAILADVRGGAHDNEIMMKYGLSPGEWRKIKDELTAAGHLASKPAAAEQTVACPSCGARTPAAAPRCRQCGDLIGRAGAGPEPAAGSPAGPPAPGPESQEPYSSAYDDWEEERHCPWEEAHDQDLWRAFIATVPRILMSPSAFFSRLPRRGGFVWPILFGVMTTTAGVVFATLWLQLFSGGFSLFGLIVTVALTLIGALIVVPITLLIGSGLIHLCLMIFGAADSGFEGTFRVIAYSSVTSLFSAVPVIGSIASFYGFYLMIVGVREVHDTSSGKAAAGVLTPTVTIFLVGALLGMLAGLSPGPSRAVERTEIVPGFSAEGLQEPLPQELCNAIDTYLSDVDYSATLGVDVAKEELRAAQDDLTQALSRHRDHPDINQVGSMVLAYGGAQLSMLIFEEKLGGTMGVNFPADELEKMREGIEGLCW